jgi:hypothetical protein
MLNKLTHQRFPSRHFCLIEAYVRPEKYWLVWAGGLANHLFYLTSFFLVLACRRQRNERQVLWMYSAASQAHSAAMDVHVRRANRFWRDVTQNFFCKTFQMKKSSGFKSVANMCSRQSARVQNSANNCWVVLVMRTSDKSPERRLFHQDTSLWTQGTTCCL